MQQRARGANRAGVVAELERVDVLRAELAAQPDRRAHVVEAVVAGLGQRAEPLAQEAHDLGVLGRARVQHSLAGRKAAELVDDVLHGALEEISREELTCGDVAEGDRAGGRRERHGGKIVGLALLEHRGVRDRAGRDHADHVALDEPLRRRGVFHLLADGDLVALLDQPRDVGLRRVERHAAHRRPLGGVFHVAVARRERQLQLLRGEDRVIVEHLIEIAQPEKQKGVRMLRLDRVVLLFHGGQFRHDRCLLYS